MASFVETIELAQPKQLTCFVCFVVSSFFVAYDRCVERRQRKVMQTAVLSAVTVSLLERMVKERTNNLAESNQKLEEATRLSKHPK